MAFLFNIKTKNASGLIKMKRLYLFTARYPYIGVENFLEDEIVFLSKKFDEVIIIPFKTTGKGCRNVPANCFIEKPIVGNTSRFLFSALICPRSFGKLASDFFSKKVYLSSRRFKVWLTAYAATNSILNSKVVRRVEKGLRKNDVCYFFWGKWSNVLAAFWKRKAHFVSRFHGQWDLWEDEYDNYAPLRNVIADSLDAAIFISEKGERYFRERYPQCNTRLFRLGTKDVGKVSGSTDGWLRVLSCSTVYPLKRVDLILQSVAEVSKTRKVEWTHLGGGDDYEKIYEQARNLVDDQFKVNMPGQMSYVDVMAFYKNNPFDVFINLSTNEGIPVSIMEAASCDVPIVATNVGGTAEIVTEETGVLVCENPTPSEVATAIISVTENRRRYSPREFWRMNYMAEKNYECFASFLSELSEK